MKRTAEGLDQLVGYSENELTEYNAPRNIIVGIANENAIFL